MTTDDHIRLHWYLPSSGETRQFRQGGTNVVLPDRDSAGPGGFRAPTLSYLTEIALAVEEAGCTSVLVPTGSSCEDPWIVSSVLLAHTRTLRFLVALHPRTQHPLLTAHHAATFQRLAGHGRLALNVVTGEPGWEARRYGDHGDKAAQYARTEEFLRIVRPLLAGESVDHTGEYFATRDASVTAPGRDLPAEPPEIWFGGSSEYARPVAARHADVYLSWLEPLDMITEKIKWLTEAVPEGRPAPRFGLRAWLLSRDTAEQAFADAERHLAGVDPAHAARARALLGARDSVGQARGQSLLEGAGLDDLDSLHVAPNLWGGFGLLAGGSALAFVGSHAEVADRLEEYRDIGVSEFILSGFPNLEEAHWLSDGLAPELRRRGLLASR
ncbi:LLM class flavin-dependent oxidoreductase [Streptomyces rubradiris]|uniref:LLM class flavin-dependent oxidoreductase n=1 Tax=Streptomyces rubradiris TaxID=285531 RepID=UPI0033F8F716